MTGPEKVTLLVAAITLLGVMITALVAIVNNRIATRQKAEADAREAWWKRSQWALDRACDPAPMTRAIGLTVLRRQQSSSLAKREDREMMVDVSLAILREGK